MRSQDRLGRTDLWEAWILEGRCAAFLGPPSGCSLAVVTLGRAPGGSRNWGDTQPDEPLTLAVAAVAAIGLARQPSSIAVAAAGTMNANVP